MNLNLPFFKFKLSNCQWQQFKFPISASTSNSRLNRISGTRRVATLVESEPHCGFSCQFVCDDGLAPNRKLYSIDYTILIRHASRNTVQLVRKALSHPCRRVLDTQRRTRNRTRPPSTDAHTFRSCVRIKREVLWTSHYMLGRFQGDAFEARDLSSKEHERRTIRRGAHKNVFALEGKTDINDHHAYQ